MTRSSVAGTIREGQAARIKEGAAHLGDIVIYDVDRVLIARSALRTIFGKRGFEAHVVETMNASAALGRAATRPTAKTIKVNVLQRPNVDTPIAYGVYQIASGAGEGGDQFKCGARVRVDVASGGVIHLAPENEEAIPECIEVAATIAGTANRLIQYAETTDLTQAVISVILGPLGGVSMRKKGGSYFLRPEASPRWLALAADLAKHGFQDLSYPMAGDARSVRAAQHVVKSSLEADLADLKRQLDEVTDKTRESTLASRVVDADAILGRVTTFSEILGNEMEGLARRAAAIRAQFQDKIPGELDPDRALFDF